MILKPPLQVKQQGPLTNQGDNIPESSPTISTSATPAAAVPVGVASHNGLNGDYVPQRRGSFLASDSSQSLAATSHMRRFDSHSLLSDNSIASSRFDVSEGAPYPE